MYTGIRTIDQFNRFMERAKQQQKDRTNDISVEEWTEALKFAHLDWDDFIDGDDMYHSLYRAWMWLNIILTCGE